MRVLLLGSVRHADAIHMEWTWTIATEFKIWFCRFYAQGANLAAEPFKSLTGGADACQAATSRVHVVHSPGAWSPGGSNVVKDSLNGFATHYMTGGTIVHDSLITGADYAPLKASSSSTTG